MAARQTFAGENAGPSWSDVDWDGVLGNSTSILSESQLFALRVLAADAKLRGDIAKRLRDADQRGRGTLQAGAKSMSP
jgi:hypothetical protein